MFIFSSFFYNSIKIDEFNSKSINSMNSMKCTQLGQQHLRKHHWRLTGDPYKGINPALPNPWPKSAQKNQNWQPSPRLSSPFLLANVLHNSSLSPDILRNLD